jgi:hypothetical protein
MAQYPRNVAPRDIESVIRDLVASGRLPSAPPARIWGGMGSGRLCSVCQSPILRSSLEYELLSATGPEARLDAGCYRLWTQLVVRGPTGPRRDG